MKVAVVGSRSFAEKPVHEEVRRRVEQFIHKLDSIDGPKTLVSGGADGPDRWAEDEAKRIGMPTDIYHPDWDEHGKAAGFLRNEKMVEVADAVVAFWDGESNGTKHTILKARENKVPCNIYVRYNHEP